MISSEWKEYKLSELVEIVGGGTPKTSVKEYWNGDIPWLSVKDFNNVTRKVYTTEKSITRKGLENSSTKLLNKGDLIISARGTVGVLAQLGRPMAFNQSCYGLKAKDITSNDFMFYLLKYKIDELKKNTHGSVFDTITRKTFDLIYAKIPPKYEQDLIVKVLSSLDEKIEINNRINEKLETIAQTIFKCWFIDFEFPNENGEPYKSSGGEMVESEIGLIPKDWEIKSLDEIADFLNGLAMQKYRPQKGEKGIPVLKIRELRQGHTDKNSDICSENIDGDYIVEDGDVIFSWSGSLLVDIWCGGKCGLNQHLFKVTSKEYEKWFYYYWTKYHLDRFIHIAEAKATTMGHIRRKDLADSKVLIPTRQVYEKANNILKPIVGLQINLKIQSRKLEKMKYSLLPKLMSGEIRVPIESE